MFKFTRVIIVVLFCLINMSMLDINGGDSVSSRYPLLLRSEVPFYPPVAESLLFGGTVEIDVVVEDGIVKDAKVKFEAIEIPSGEGWQSKVKGEGNGFMRYLTTPSLENLKTWRFDPLAKGRFTVTFIYKIEGEETLFPENHKIELDLPLTIKITARPLKPQQW